MLLFYAALATASEPHFEEFDLENGLHVILLEDHTLPKVVVDVWYDVGGFDDPEGRSGFAHLFEHLMFKGTERMEEGEFDTRLEGIGGSNNASTADTRTNYYEVAPSSALDLMLWLEADRMTGLQITKAAMKVEREVVRNERRQNYEDRPYGSIWVNLPEMLYPQSHPLHRPTIGSHADLLAAKLKDVKAFYRTWYVPSNASLAIAGDFEPTATRAQVQALFGGLPKVAKPTRALQPQPDVPTVAFREVKEDVPLALVVYAWHSPAFYAPGDTELDVLGRLLAGSDDARLTRRLVHDERAAQDVQVFQSSDRFGSLFMAMVWVSPDHGVEEVENAITEELAKIATEPPTDDEIARARNNLQTSLVYGAETLMDRAEAAQRYRFNVGRVDYFDEDIARYDAVTALTIASAAAKLTPDRAAHLRILPAKAPTGGAQ